MNCKLIALIITVLFGCGSVWSQSGALQIVVKDAGNQQPLQGATISGNAKPVSITDSLGKAVVASIYKGRQITVSLTGFAEYSFRYDSSLQHKEVLMVAVSKALADVVVVASTRNNASIENSPLKVEVLGQEEMKEEAALKPGNIASILGDYSGIQIQQSSAISGNSNVRIQGLDGRYTQVLRDGMPLYEGFSGGFGILTIPPLDLRQIELIKGSASTLYGGGAIGGLVNIISRRPIKHQELDVVLNTTTLRESNVNLYTANRNDKVGYNIFAGANVQASQDVNNDGMSDVPKTNSYMFHPRLFLYPAKGAQVIVGYNGIWDKRIGGDMQVIDKNEGPAHKFFEQNNSVRHTGELLYEQQLKGKAKLTLKGSYSHFNLQTTSNTFATKGVQENYYSELFVFKPFGESSLVAGINANGDMFKTLTPDTAALKKFNNHYIGAFVQYSWQITKTTILEGGLRTDHHNEYGWFTLPRIALFHRFDDHWATRAGFGMGYKAPNPLSKTIVDFTLLQLQPLSPSVKAERSYGLNAEVNYKYEWGEDNTIFINQAFFLTQISTPVLFNEQADKKVTLYNADGPVLTAGSDTYVQMELDGWELYLGYTFTNALRKYLAANQFMPLTPKHRFATVIAKEFSDHWFAGIEASYNGVQKRLDYSSTPGYLFAAAMMRYSFNKHWSVVLNCENLLDFRQSKKEPLFTGSLLNPQFVPLWAPIDGRVANISVRWKL